MSYIRRQIKTDAAIESILEANAEQVLEEREETAPTAEQKALVAREPILIQRIHVDDQGFLTTRNELRRIRPK